MEFAVMAYIMLMVLSLTSQKRVNNVKREDAKKYVSTLLKAVDAVNSLDRDAVSINGLPLEKAVLPKWIQPFVMPKSVALLNTTKMLPDLVKRPNVAESDFNQTDVIRAARWIAGVLRVQEPVMATVEELRGADRTLSEITPMVDGWARLKSDAYEVPVVLIDECLPMFGDLYLRDDGEVAIREFISRELKFNSTSN